jgi:ABC-type glycerol-3-phosphate transport system substrate-binding protein
MLFSRSRSTHILLVSTFMVLTACLAVSAATDQLIIWHWDAHASGLFAQWLEYAKVSFEEKHPEVEVVYQYVPFGPDRFVLAASAACCLTYPSRRSCMPETSMKATCYCR